MWIYLRDVRDNKKLYDNQQLEDEICHNREKIYFIDGPSGCGKTHFLKNMESKVTIYPFHLLLEDFEKYICQGTDFKAFAFEMMDKYTSGEFLCFEDIDFGLAGKPETQKEFAKLFSILSYWPKLILTGIDIDKRCITLLKALESYNYEYYYFSEENKNDESF